MTPTAAHAAALKPSPDLVVGGRPLSAYQPFRWAHAAHRAGASLSDIVGYVVRRTIADDGEILWNDEERTSCGYDVAVLPAPHLYGQALDVALEHRGPGDGYAVVDRLYACGCRS